MDVAQTPPPECTASSQGCQDVGSFLSASQSQYHAYAKGRRLRPLVTHSRPSLATSGPHIPPITSLSKEKESTISTDFPVVAVPASSIDSGLAGSLRSIERKLGPAQTADTVPTLTSQSTSTNSSAEPSSSSARRAPRSLPPGPPRAFNTRFNKSLPTTANNMEAPRPVAMRKGTPCASREMEPNNSAITEEPTESIPISHQSTTSLPLSTLALHSATSTPPAEKVSQAFHAALTEAQTRENTMINTRRIPPNLDVINKSLGLSGSAADANVENENESEQDAEAQIDVEGKVHWRQRLASHRTISQATMTTSTSILEDDEDESDDSCAGNTRDDAAGKDQSKDKQVSVVAVPVLAQVAEKPSVAVAPAVIVSEPLATFEPSSSSTSNEPATATPIQLMKLIPDSLLITPPQGPPEPILTSLPPVADLVDIPLNHPATSTNIAAHTKLDDGHRDEMHIVTAGADTADLSYSSLSEFPTARAVASTPPTPTVHTSALDACPSIKVQRPPASKLAQTIHGLMNQRKQAAAAKESPPKSAVAIDRRDSALARSNSSVKPGMRETVARMLQSTLSRTPAPVSSSAGATTLSDGQGGGRDKTVADTLPVVELAASSSPNASVRSIASSRKSRVASNASSRTKKRWWARLFGGVGGGMGEGVAVVNGGT